MEKCLKFTEKIAFKVLIAGLSLFFLNLTVSPQKAFGNEWSFKGEISWGIFEPYQNGHDEEIGAVLDTFSGNWQAWTVHADQYIQWAEMPSFLALGMEGELGTSSLRLKTKLPVRRDIRTWHQAEWKHSGVFHWRDLDINQPEASEIHWQSPHWTIRFGRFKTHWSFQPDFSLVLASTVPFLDGYEIRYSGKHFEFWTLGANLNAWLAGTPQSIPGEFPVGSEEWQQRNPSPSYSNNHLRIHDTKRKTLFAHRLFFKSNAFKMGITEIAVIGGRNPHLTDMIPILTYHNHYDHGASNLAINLDMQLSLAETHFLFGEVFLDDINFSATETENDSPTQMGISLGYQWRSFLRHLNLKMQWIQTDPFVYNHWTPLTKLTARRVIKSNGDKLEDSPFVDTFVADIPIGYWRGPGCRDLWVTLSLPFEWDIKGEGRIQYGWLTKGYQTLYTPFSDYLNNSSDVENKKEQQLWVAQLSLQWPSEWSTSAKWGINHFQNTTENTENTISDSEIFYHIYVQKSFSWD